MTNYVPAKEIDGSLASHRPITYKVSFFLSKILNYDRTLFAINCQKKLNRLGKNQLLQLYNKVFMSLLLWIWKLPVYLHTDSYLVLRMGWDELGWNLRKKLG